MDIIDEFMAFGSSLRLFCFYWISNRLVELIIDDYSLGLIPESPFLIATHKKEFWINRKMFSSCFLSIVSAGPSRASQIESFTAGNAKCCALIFQFSKTIPTKLECLSHSVCSHDFRNFHFSLLDERSEMLRTARGVKRKNWKLNLIKNQ